MLIALKYFKPPCHNLKKKALKITAIKKLNFGPIKAEHHSARCSTFLQFEQKKTPRSLISGPRIKQKSSDHV